MTWCHANATYSWHSLFVVKHYLYWSVTYRSCTWFQDRLRTWSLLLIETTQAPFLPYTRWLWVASIQVSSWVWTGMERCMLQALRSPSHKSHNVFVWWFEQESVYRRLEEISLVKAQKLEHWPLSIAIWKWQGCVLESEPTDAFRTSTLPMNWPPRHWKDS